MKKDERKYSPVYIDGQPWAVRLPTGGSREGEPNEWDTIMKMLGDNKDLMHWYGMASWCQEEKEGIEGHRVHRGGFTPDRWNYTNADRRLDVGFRPVLVPLDPNTLQFAPERIAYLKDGSALKLGTLYQDGSPLPVPTDIKWNGDIPHYNSGELRVGNTHEDKRNQITFIKCGGFLIADRPLMQHISWNDLQKQGLVFGKGKEEPENIFYADMTTERFEKFLRDLQNDGPYRWPNAYFAWEKPDGSLFMIGTATTSMYHLLRHELEEDRLPEIRKQMEDLKIDGEPVYKREYVTSLYGISPTTVYMQGSMDGPAVPFDPVEKLVNEISGYKYLGAWEDPAIMIPSNSLGQVRAHGRWELAKEHILSRVKKPSLEDRISGAEKKSAGAKAPRKKSGHEPQR